MGSSELNVWRRNLPIRSVLSRSEAIAVGDAGVLHLDGDGPLPAGLRIVDHGAMDLADRRRGDRHRIPVQEDLVRRRAELLVDDLGGEVAAHRWGVGSQLGEGLTNRLGQAVVEVAGHLPDLHQRPLHLPEAFGDLFGRAQLSFGVDLDAPWRRGEQLAGRRRGVGRPDVETDPCQLEVACPTGRV